MTPSRSSSTTTPGAYARMACSLARVASASAAAARAAASARSRRDTSASCMPMAITRSMVGGQGARPGLPRNDIIKKVSPPETSGTASAVPSPQARAAAARGRRVSFAKSSIHTGRRLCHTMPGRSRSGSKLMARVARTKAATSAPGCGAISSRRGFPLPSSPHTSHRCHSRRRHTSSPSTRHTSGTERPAANASATVRCTARRSSASTAAVTSLWMTTAPPQPHASPHGSGSARSRKRRSAVGVLAR